MPNKERINQIIEQLRQDKAVGTHFRMDSFCEYLDPSRLPINDTKNTIYCYQECNTVLCLAGWANYFRLKATAPDILDKRHFVDEAGDATAAARWLGITLKQRNELFLMQNERGHSILGPRGEPVPLKWFELQSQGIRYDAGIRVLEILRDEGVVDWDRAITDAGGKLPE